MKKIIVAVLAFLSLNSLALAENSGFFVGGQINGGMVSKNTQGSYTVGAFSYEGMGKDNAGFFGLGLLVGYKHFFAPKFGVRIYVDSNGNAYRQEEQFGSSTFKVYSRIGINVDLLANYLDTAESSQGFFAGLNYTKVTWNKDAAESPWNLNNNKSSSGLGMNAGWRLKEGSHNIEVGAMIPFYKETVMHTGDNGQSLSMQERFSMFVRYIYDFSF